MKSIERPLSAAYSPKRERARLPVRAMSTIPNGSIIFMKAAILLGLPVHCMIREFLSTCTTRAWKRSAVWTISARFFPLALTFTRTSSLSTNEPGTEYSSTSMTLTSFLSCFTHCSTLLRSSLTGYARILAAAYGADIEGFYIEAPAAEHSGDPCEDAELIFHECRYGVFHMIAKT